MLDTSCESMKNQEIIRQILSVYEALMAYTVNSWSRETPPEIANKLIELHKAYSIVAEFAMVTYFTYFYKTVVFIYFIIQSFHAEISLIVPLIFI